jgi:hypothetical protein
MLSYYHREGVKPYPILNFSPEVNNMGDDIDETY